MLSAFRVLSIVEGLSFLLILSVTIGWISRDHVFPLGISHGLLFVLYLIGSMMLAHQRRWGLGIWLPLFLASVIPLAFIAVELFLRRSAGEHQPEPQ